MELKALCNSYSAFDGQLIFWMLPYRGLQTDVIISDLNAIEPEVIYVNTKTKERTPTPPESYVKAKALADALNTTVRGDWKEEVVWTVVHKVFYLFEPTTIEIEFHFTETTSAELRLFREYWEGRDPDTATRWTLFKQLIGRAITVAWQAAYEATRDHVLEAPPALQTEVGKTASPEKKDSAPKRSVTSKRSPSASSPAASLPSGD